MYLDETCTFLQFFLIFCTVAMATAAILGFFLGGQFARSFLQ